MTNTIGPEPSMATPLSRRKVERADGPASVLAIGTANPPNLFPQDQYPDWYFNVTNSNHMSGVKEKFRRMCERSGIKQRYLYLNDEILKANPSLCEHWEKSLNVRQDMVVVEIPKMAKEAAVKAIKEWGQPKSKITHLIFCTTSGVDMPGADWALTKLLGLRPSIKRLMVYQQGCFAGGKVMRVAKDFAENNKGARVLLVCSEITAVTFRGPSESRLDSLVGQALFSDGAAALIVGSDPIPKVEKPWFEIHWSGTNILPDSDGAIQGHVREEGLIFHLMKDVPGIISKNVGGVIKDAFKEVFAEEEKGAPTCNDVFWIVHPGGPSILDQMEENLQLKPEKMASSREVLLEFGNMSSGTVLFIMDHMRKKSVEQKMSTTGEGHEWGLLLGFGPGITCETIVLRSVPLVSQ